MPLCRECRSEYDPPPSRRDWPMCRGCTLNPPAARAAAERKRHMLAALKRKRAAR